MTVAAVGRGAVIKQMLKYVKITLEMIAPSPPKFSQVILLNIHLFAHSLTSILIHLHKRLSVISDRISPVGRMGLLEIDSFHLGYFHLHKPKRSETLTD